MLTRCLLLLLALPCWAPAATAQDLRADYADQRWRVRVRDAWVAADGEGREAAAAHLAQSIPKHAPVGAAPGTQDLLEAYRLLRGGDANVQGQHARNVVNLERFLLATELRCQPGIFSVITPDEGDLSRPITVSAVPRKGYAFGREQEFSLYWLGPEGEELRARTETVGPRLQRHPGWEMFIHAPRSAPGLWHVVLEAEIEGETLRGVPFPIACVEVFRERADTLPPEAGPQWAKDELRLRLEAGVQMLDGYSSGGLLELLEGGELGARTRRVQVPEIARPVDCLGVEPARAAVAVVLLSAPDEMSSRLLEGKTGERWESFASEHEAWVGVLAAEHSKVTSPEVATLCAWLREQGARRVVLVVRRSLALGYALQARQGRAPFAGDGKVDAVVMRHLAKGDEPAPLAGVPALFYEPGAASDEVTDLEGEGAPAMRARSTTPPIVFDVELPELVGRWWARAAGR